MKNQVKNLLIGVNPHGHNVYLSLEIEKVSGKKNKFTTDLEPISEYSTLSICGEEKIGREIISCGQILDDVKKEIDSYKRLKIDRSVLLRIIEIWEEWHLNDLRAGTTKQQAVVKEWESEGNKYNFTKASELLDKKGLLYDKAYKYGSSWLVDPLPENIEKEIKELFNI